jgi:hypothetical protein
MSGTNLVQQEVRLLIKPGWPSRNRGLVRLDRVNVSRFLLNSACAVVSPFGRTLGSYRAISALNMLSVSERKAHRNPSAAARTCGCVRMEW